MNIEFETKALEELYTTGATSDSAYKRLSKDVIKRYIKVVNYLKAARRIEDLFYIKSLPRSTEPKPSSKRAPIEKASALSAYLTGATRCNGERMLHARS